MVESAGDLGQVRSSRDVDNECKSVGGRQQNRNQRQEKHLTAASCQLKRCLSKEHGQGQY